MNLRRDESGQSLVIAAIFLALVGMGFIALALDVGQLFRQRRMAQAAADGAALAAASEIALGHPANEQTVANAMATANGFDTTLASNPAVVQLSSPSSGSFTGSSYVTATVSRPIPTIFMRAFGSKFATQIVSATATAGGASSSPTCVCLEGGTGEDLNLSNNSKLNAQACGVVDNSSSSNAVGIVGSATLNALSLGTVSTTWNNSSNINNNGSITSSTKIVQGITTKCSPAMPATPSYSGCVADPGGSYGTHTWGPSNVNGVACYQGLTVGANGSTDTLNPGTYVITSGTLHFESGSGGHSNLGGNGVFFYLTGTASLVIDNGANVNLVAGGTTQSGGATAPTVGSYNGILLYQSASDTSAVSVQGGSTAYLNGSFYAPGANITLGNGSGTGVSGGIVASTLTMNGGGTLNAAADTNEGSLVTGSAKVVQ